jgi:oligopeptide/dipeptide ABC transporter ATP-binding protein
MISTPNASPLLETVDLVKSFPIHRGFFGQHRLRLLAVDRVSLQVQQGETLGLVGESGCGKSTLALTMMHLYVPTSGVFRFDGHEVKLQDAAVMHKMRREMQMIFQDPFASVDPRLSVEQIIREPLDIHSIGSSAERIAEAHRLLGIVGLSSDAAMRFPNEFSGGQQQRIGIARALALQPKILICDEPVSSLDVSVQAQILNLLRDLQQEFKLTYLFISHNIAVTGFMSNRIGVMYLGRLMEIGRSKDIVNHPRHPYTQALLTTVPEPDPKLRGRQRAIRGEVPSPIDKPTGCPFHPRCPIVQARCKQEEPQLRTIADDHAVACHFA